MVEGVSEFTRVRVRVEFGITDDVVVGYYRGCDSAAIVAGKCAAERRIFVVRVDAEAFTTCVQVPSLSVHTIGEDDVRDLRERFDLWRASGCRGREAVVDGAGAQAGP